MNSPARYLQNDFKSTKSNSSMAAKMTPDLAEICGIHAGDGYMRKRKSGYELEISGGFDEKEYYDSWVVPLYEKVFGIKITPQYFKTKGTYGFRICKKEVCELLHSCGFPYGKKTFTVEVPKQVLESRNLDIIYRFIRGVFDTDGTLSFRKRQGSGYKKIHQVRHTSPRIMFGVCSQKLRNQVAKLLLGVGVDFYIEKRKPNDTRNIVYSIIVSGDRSIVYWMYNIGFKNQTKYNRYLIWKGYGFNPPNLTLDEQKNILLGKIDPNEFYRSNKNYYCPGVNSTVIYKENLIKTVLESNP